MNLSVIYEDREIIVVIKPPKILSQYDQRGGYSMIDLIQEHLEKTCGKKDAYVGVIHRLDRPVGGVMVYGKTKNATSHICEQIRCRTFKKEYHVVTMGEVTDKQKTLTHYLLKDGKNHVSDVVEENNPEGKKAVLSYCALSSIEEDEQNYTLLKIALETGRYHQIRAQLGAENIAIWGDSKYNKAFKRKRGWHQIALWSTKIDFDHPTKDKRLSFHTEDYLKQYPFSLFV